MWIFKPSDHFTRRMNGICQPAKFPSTEMFIDSSIVNMGPQEKYSAVKRKSHASHEPKTCGEIAGSINETKLYGLARCG